MKKVLFFYFILLMNFVSSQNVIFNKIVKTDDNNDKFLYKIDPKTPNLEYLGEIEIQGFSNNDVEVFDKIYKKAKEIGANAFAYQPFDTIEGVPSQFDPSNYKLKLYYLPKEQFPSRNNTVFLIASPNQDKTIEFNKEKIKFLQRTYTERKTEAGKTYTINTRKLLGSTIKKMAKANDPVSYFQIIGFQIGEDNYGQGKIQIKSGDLVPLERSFAEFLTTIYQEF